MKNSNIIERTIKAKAEANLSPNVEKLEFSAEATEHLLLVLTNMYRNPVAASIREYLSNAKDANKRAGVKNQIEVTWDDTAYTVRDYGVGMSLDVLKNNYFKYGGTDKTDLAEEIGGYGLGCKSGLAVDGVVEVTTWHDGIESRGVATLKPGINTVEYSEPKASDKASGTLVRVPFAQSANHNRLEEVFRGSELLAFWDADSEPLYLNGSLYEPVGYRTPIVGANLTLTDSVSGSKIWVVPESSSYASRICISLGGVPYNVDSSVLTELPDSIKEDLGFNISNINNKLGQYHSFYIDVPMTSLVKLTPARDTILYNEQTISNLCQIITSAVTAAKDAVTSMLNSSEAKDIDLVVSRFPRWILGNSGDKEYTTFEWRGETVNPRTYIEGGVSCYSYKGDEKIDKVSLMKRLYVSSNPERHYHVRYLVVATAEEQADAGFQRMLERNTDSLKKKARQTDPRARYSPNVETFFVKDASAVKSDPLVLSLFEKVFDSVEEFNNAGLAIRRENKTTYTKRDGINDEPRHYVAGKVSVDKKNKHVGSYSGRKKLSNNEIKALESYIIVEAEEGRYSGYANSVMASKKTELRIHGVMEFLSMFPNETVVILPAGRKISVFEKLNPNFVTPMQFILNRLKEVATTAELKHHMTQFIVRDFVQAIDTFSEKNPVSNKSKAFADKYRTEESSDVEAGKLLTMIGSTALNSKDSDTSHDLPGFVDGSLHFILSGYYRSGVSSLTPEHEFYKLRFLDSNMLSDRVLSNEGRAEEVSSFFELLDTML